MKKLLSVLVVLLIAAPAMAGVTVTCRETSAPDPCGVVEIWYEADDSQDLARAFALDISVSDGNVALYDPCDDLGELDPNYWVYPGQIVIDEGVVTNPNTPVASGNGALVPPTGLTIEMASLYYGESNAPDPCGLLCKVQTTQNCTVSIVGNATRGNVVMESATAVEVDSDCQVTRFAEGCQCWGDVSGPSVGVPDTQVSVFDLSYIVGYLSPAYSSTGYTGPISPGMECADVSGPSVGVPDNQISVFDLSYIVGYLSPAYSSTGYTGPCMP